MSHSSSAVFEVSAPERKSSDPTNVDTDLSLTLPREGVDPKRGDGTVDDPSEITGVSSAYIENRVE